MPTHYRLHRHIDERITWSAVAEPGDWHDVLDNAVDVVIDGGYSGTEPTTVIDLSGEAPVLLRQGKGSAERLGL